MSPAPSHRSPSVSYKRHPVERDPVAWLAAVEVASKSAFRKVLAIPCPSHLVPAGEPCWTVHGSHSDHRALCGPRAAAAGQWQAVTPRSLTQRPRERGQVR